MKICPICQQEKQVINTTHLKSCCKKLNLQYDEEYLKYIITQSEFSELANKAYLEELYINKKYTLNQIVLEYGISRPRLESLLLYHGFHLKGISESGKDCAERKKQTYLKKYGVENPSQLQSIKDKKKETSLKNYGVDNIWKSKNYMSIVRKTILEKHGISLEEYRSICSREVWENKSKEEKEIWYQNSIGSVNKTHGKGIVRSKAEIEISKILLDFGLNIESSLNIWYEKKRYFCYDILIKDYKLIIEYNGDIYHANPKYYKEDDILLYPLERVAKDIWMRDSIKKSVAEVNGYKLVYIWESEYRKNKFKEKEYLLNILKENGIEII